MEREKLLFKEHSLEYFKFLIDNYEFEIETADLYKICYHKDKIRVSILHEKLSFELYIILEVNGADRVYSDLNQLLEQDNIPTRFYQGSTLENIDFCLKHISQELQTFIMNHPLDNELWMGLIKKLTMEYIN